MDTKWNNTHDDAGIQDALDEVFATVEQVQEQAQSGDGESPVSVVWVGKKPGPVLRAIAGFLAFFLGLSLLIGSLGQIVGRQVWARDPDQWWRGDWQETGAFRWYVADYLEAFLTLGAGGSLNWYGDTQDYEDSYEWNLYKEYGVTWAGTAQTVSPGTDEPETGEAEDRRWEPEADVRYREDKNVLYRIERDGTLLYSNADGAMSGFGELPAEYNFLLTFADGKTTILKSGVGELDVYGDGIYDADSDWFVPGYENFQAGEAVDGVVVRMAVRAQPVQYLKGNYASGSVQRSNHLYWLYQGLQESKAFYKTRAAACGAGLVLLALYAVLRRSKAQADRAVARVTAHVWTELRALIVLGCLVWLGAAGDLLSQWASELQWTFVSGEAATYVVEMTGRYGISLLEHTAPLLVLFWVVYLIVNDHRYTPKEARKSLLGLVAVKERKYPFQRRLSRWNRAAAVMAALPLVTCAGFGILALTETWPWSVNPYLMMLVVPLIMTLISALAVWLALRRDGKALQDAGQLMDQVAAVHDGDLTTPLELPEDSDLRRTAEQLNDIQAGMERALAEQTHSERMKVELISNVSHDLKTPLTSILTYAELLTQEEGLPDHVLDYARIIDQKARRLSAMVGDVFEVSKAAAGQLPVKLERLDFAKLLRQTLADLDEPIRRSGLTFKVDLPEGAVPVVADGDRMYRVFQNLVQNALKYAMPGSRVYLTLTAGGGLAEASLRNTSRDELPAGVDFTARFTRGDESRSDGGSGLGLSIASSFTEACGGAFRVETVADLFTAIVTLPLAGEAER